MKFLKDFDEMEGKTISGKPEIANVAGRRCLKIQFTDGKEIIIQAEVEKCMIGLCEAYFGGFSVM